MAKCLFALCLVGAIFGPTLHAQTINAAGCDPSSVQKALNSVNQATATVIMPTGTCSWTSAITYAVPSVNTSLTIEGQTQVNCTGTPGTSSYSCTPTDGTIIQDSYQVTCCSNQLLIITTGGASQYLRITGITFEGGTLGSANNAKQPALQIAGSSDNVRIDHCHFNSNTYDVGDVGSWVRVFNPEGVVDHSEFDLGNNSSYDEGITTYNDITNTGAADPIGYADGSWSTPSAWGTATFWFIEDNVFNGGFSNDCAGGGRFVERYNTLNDMTNGVQDHSTKTQASPYGYRGCRAEEVYHDYFTGPNGNGLAAIGMKGATGLVWGNTLASGYGHLYNGQTDRNTTNEVETNAPNGWGYCGTSVAGNGVGSQWDGNSPPTIGYPCLDGVGRGQTQQALNGAAFPNKLNSSTGTMAWPQQYLEPVYLFMNTVSAGDEGYLSDNGATAWERDVYPDCGNTSSDCSGSFNGSKGTGYGALANRPSTCTAGPGGTYATSPTGSYGVGYWATDENTLYVCTSANTWTAMYTPYTYPHPLDGGTAPPTGSSGPSSSAPPPPTGLSATVQ